MPDTPKQKQWKPNARDAIFVVIVVAVVLVLSLSSHKRMTKATPNDATHIHATSREQCMHCHSAGGVRPQPKGHTKEDQCFLCHAQPKDWVGKAK